MKQNRDFRKSLMSSSNLTTLFCKRERVKRNIYMVKRNVKITLKKAIEWYNSDDEYLKDLALQGFTKEELIYNFRDITTFKKACDELGYNYDDIVSKVKSIAEISKASAAMFKLNIIRKALNAGYDMHISRNVDGQKGSYYPFFRSEEHTSELQSRI